MKKILVPTDFSDFALNAAKLAADLAKKTGARVYFMHAVHIPSTGAGNLPGFPSSESQNIPEGIFILKHVKKKFKELMAMDFLKDINVGHAVSFNGIFESINEQVEKLDIDLIIMGTHGTSGYVNDFFIGSNTDKVVRLSETPVIAIRDEVKDCVFERIVFASDFEEGVENSFDAIQELIDLFEAQVDLVRVITRDDFYFSDPMLEIMEDFAKKRGLKKYTCHVFSADNVQEGINEFAKRNNANMITTITNGRRGLARLFNGSVTGDLLKSSPLPILTIKAKK